MSDTIVIQQIYPGLGFDKLLELTQAHHKDYCDKRGFEYRPVFDNVTKHDPNHGAYAKVKLIQTAMQEGYKYIIWLDADTLIIDFDANLLEAVTMHKIGASWHRLPQLNHWNVGVLYVHNSDETRLFIDKWLASYPPPNDGWKEQGVFNRMGRESKVVVTVSDRWNATLDVSMVPDAVVLGFHGQGDAEYRYKVMKNTMARLFPDEKAETAQEEREVVK